MQRTASQTVGPFFLDALIHDGDEVIAKPGTAGRQIFVEGVVLDGEGNPVSDAFIEIAQADAAGRVVADRVELRAGAHFSGFGRASTDISGKFRFTTVYPGAIVMNRTSHAPHLNVMVFARGLLKPLVTRIYFAGDAMNAVDPVLTVVPAHRRATLEAKTVPAGDVAVWRFDLRLQGKGETVFFDF